MTNSDGKNTKGVQQIDIWMAADAILMAGDRPTVVRVRQEMGRGSPNTIGPHLDDWFTNLGVRLSRANKGEKEIPSEIHTQMIKLWEIAQNVASANALAALSHEKERLTQDQLNLNAHRQDVHQREIQLIERKAGMEESQRLASAQIELIGGQLRDSQKALQERQKRLDAMAVEHKKTEADLQNVIRANDQKEHEHQSKYKELQFELRQSQDEGKRLKKENQDLADQIQQSERTISELREQMQLLETSVQSRMLEIIKNFDTDRQTQTLKKVRPASPGKKSAGRTKLR